jgi:simple sugar transport system permease protein
MVRFSFPVLVASLGEAVSERSGVYNLGLEGYMMFGAFFGFLASVLSGSVIVGLLCGVIAGALLALLHAYLSITLRIDQIISGIGLWLFALGVTTFLYRVAGTGKTVPTTPEVNLGILSDLPFVGNVLFKQNVLVYLGLALVAVFAVLINRSAFGLLVKAVGDNPVAVDLAGHNVARIRYMSVLVSGAMGGLAGAYLPLAVLGSYAEDVTAGKGFIALVVVVFGQWDPIRILLGSFVFAGAEAFQMRLQAVGLGIPAPLLLMFPYILTLAILVAFSRRGRPPLALGVPYVRGGE